MAERQYKLVKCNINGKDVATMVDVRASLTDMLRNNYHLTSVKKGCEVGECGACSVLIDGEAFNSCIYMAIWAEGKKIITLEGLTGPNGELSDIQQAFVFQADPLGDPVDKRHFDMNADAPDGLECAQAFNDIRLRLLHDLHIRQYQNQHQYDDDSGNDQSSHSFLLSFPA